MKAGRAPLGGLGQQASQQEKTEQQWAHSGENRSHMSPRGNKIDNSLVPDCAVENAGTYPPQSTKKQNRIHFCKMVTRLSDTQMPQESSISYVDMTIREIGKEGPIYL